MWTCRNIKSVGHGEGTSTGEISEGVQRQRRMFTTTQADNQVLLLLLENVTTLHRTKRFVLITLLRNIPASRYEDQLIWWESLVIFNRLWSNSGLWMLLLLTSGGCQCVLWFFHRWCTCVCLMWEHKQLVSGGSEPSGGIVSGSTFALLLIIKKIVTKKNRRCSQPWQKKEKNESTFLIYKLKMFYCQPLHACSADVQ